MLVRLDVVDAAPWHAAEDAKGVIMGVEQHLVGLLEIGPQGEGATVGQLELGDQQLGPLAGDDRPVLRPIELEGLARREDQGNEGPATAGLLLALPSSLPVTGKGRHPIVGTVVAERGQIGMQLFDRALLLARLRRLDPQHRR